MGNFSIRSGVFLFWDSRVFGVEVGLATLGVGFSGGVIWVVMGRSFFLERLIVIFYLVFIF